MKARSEVDVRPATPRLPALPDTWADRRAYLQDGLSEVDCDSCGVTVRVKKSSAQQTSIQWSAAAVRGCTELAGRGTHGQPAAVVATCTRLRDSIARAVRDGRLDIRTDPS